MKKLLILLIFISIFSSFVSASLTDNLYAYFNFNENSFDIHSTHDLIEMGTVVNDNINYKLGGGSYYFSDTTGQLLYWNDFDLDTYTNATFCAWINVTDVAASRTVFGADFTNQDEYYMYVDTNGYASANFRDTTSYTGTDVVDITDGQFHLVCYGFNNQGQGFIRTDDNVRVSISDMSPESFDWGNFIGIGGTYKGGSTSVEFKGHIDEVGIWTNRLLDDISIDELYSSGNGLEYPFTNLTLSLNILSPSNNTGINSPTNITFILNYVNESANCTFSVNDIELLTKTGLVNSTYSFIFNSTNWIDHTSNDLLINCTDFSNNIYKTLNITVKTVPPKLINVTYTDEIYTNKIFNDSIHSVYKYFNFSVLVNNTYLDSLNVTILEQSTNTVIYSNLSTGLGPGEFLFNSSLNLTNENRGTYIMNITVSDAVGGTPINFVNFEILFYNYFSNINVNLYDATTLNLLTENLTVQYVGTNYQDEKTTTSGTTFFNVTFEGSTDIADIIAFSTKVDHYSIVTQTNTYTQSQDYTVNMYLANTSDTDKNKLISFQVKDEDSNNVRNAIIHIYKRNPATNEFLLVTDLTTNSNGEASTYLVLDTVFYRFTVEYDGELVYIASNVVTVTDSTTLPIVLGAIIGDSFSEYHQNILGFDYWFYPIRTGNETGYFTLRYLSDEPVEVCLKSYYTTLGVEYGEEEICYSDLSKEFNSQIFTLKTESIAYGELWVTYTNTNLPKQKVDTLSMLMGYKETDDTNRLFVYLALIVITSIVFIYSPIVGLVIFALGNLAIAFTGFTLIGTSWAIGVISFTILIIITLVKNGNK